MRRRASDSADAAVRAGLTDAQQARLSQIPAKHDGAYRRQYVKACEGHSLRAAANAMCLECVQWQRTEVAACTARACPLYPYRPYR